MALHYTGRHSDSSGSSGIKNIPGVTGIYDKDFININSNLYEDTYLPLSYITEMKLKKNEDGKIIELSDLEKTRELERISKFKNIRYFETKDGFDLANLAYYVFKFYDKNNNNQLIPTNIINKIPSKNDKFISILIKEWEKKTSIDLTIGHNEDKIDIVRSMCDGKSGYRVSNLEYFFKYLLYKNEFKQGNIYVVCHRGTMKRFLENDKIKKSMFSSFSKSMFSSFSNSSKINYEKQNLWSINMKTNKGEVLITRSAFSVANMLKEKGKKENLKWDYDSKLSIYGIVSSMKFNLPGLEYEKESIIVYVSPLIRTWMTAACLYLKYTDNLELVISPFLIEDKDRGVFTYVNNRSSKPYDIKTQLEHYNTFMELYKKITTKIDSKIDLNKKRVTIIYSLQYQKTAPYKIKVIDLKNDEAKNVRNFRSKIEKKTYYGSESTCRYTRKKVKNDSMKIETVQIYSGFDKPSPDFIQNSMMTL
jgi:hypothetical protein